MSLAVCLVSLSVAAAFDLEPGRYKDYACCRQGKRHFTVHLGCLPVLPCCLLANRSPLTSDWITPDLHEIYILKSELPTCTTHIARVIRLPNQTLAVNDPSSTLHCPPKWPEPAPLPYRRPRPVLFALPWPPGPVLPTHTCHSLSASSSLGKYPPLTPLGILGLVVQLDRLGMRTAEGTPLFLIDIVIGDIAV